MMKNIKNIFFANFWLKVLSLILAVGTWLHINGELGRVIKP